MLLMLVVLVVVVVAVVVEGVMHHLCRRRMADEGNGPGSVFLQWPSVDATNLLSSWMLLHLHSVSHIKSRDEHDGGGLTQVRAKHIMHAVHVHGTQRGGRTGGTYLILLAYPGHPPPPRPDRLKCGLARLPRRHVSDGTHGRLFHHKPSRLFAREIHYLDE